jgi:hypothetical protein
LTNGLILNDLRLVAGKSGFWIAMPAQRQPDRDGNPRTEANGRAVYTQIVEFRDRSTADRFAAMVLALIRDKHPDALDEAER